MNLWVVGRSAEAGRAVAALEELLARLPFFPGCAVDSWSAGDVRAAWVSHDPERYVSRGGDSLALWSGWPGATGDDGRFARVRASPAGVEVEVDPMGAYPVYTGGGWWSNNPELVRGLAGSGGLSEGVVASMVARRLVAVGRPRLERRRQARAPVSRRPTSCPCSAAGSTWTPPPPTWSTRRGRSWTGRGGRRSCP